MTTSANQVECDKLVDEKVLASRKKRLATDPNTHALRRIPNFVAHLPVNGRSSSAELEACIVEDESSSDSSYNYSQLPNVVANIPGSHRVSSSTDLEETQLVKTLMRMRKARNVVPTKYNTSENLWEAVNQTKASMSEQFRSSEGNLNTYKDADHKVKEAADKDKNAKQLTRTDSNPSDPLQTVSKSEKKLKNSASQQRIFRKSVEFHDYELQRPPSVVRGRKRKRKIKSVVYQKQNVPEEEGTQGFMKYIEEDKEAVETFSLTLDSKQQLPKKNAAPSLFRYLEHRSVSQADFGLESQTVRLRRSRKRSVDRKSLSDKLNYVRTARRRSSASLFTEKLFELGLLLRGTSVLMNSIFKTIDDVPIMHVNKALEEFDENVAPLLPMVDTLIDEISPSQIKRILWGLGDLPSSFVAWNDLDFLGNVYMTGVLFLNNEFTIIERLSACFDKKKSVKSAQEYVGSVIESDGNIASLEKMRAFPLVELATRVFSGLDSTVLVTASGGFYVLASDIIAGPCVGQYSKISFWTGSYYIPSLQNHVVVKVACGAAHFLALSRSGDVFSWGANCKSQCGRIIVSYQLGHSSKEFVSKPRQIDIKGFAFDVACGFSHSAILSTVGLYTFGSNDFGELGRTNDSRLAIVPTSETWNSVQVTCGKNFTIVLTCKRKLIGWGSNEYFQLSSEHASTVETPVDLGYGHLDICQVAGGMTHCVACTVQGEVYCWGSNLIGELGSITNRPRNKAVHVPIPHPVKSVTCGGFSNAAITNRGEVYTWGMLRSKNYTHHQWTPRLLESANAKNIFAANVSCGITHTFVMSDVASTQLLQMFQSACKYEGWYKATQLRISLLSLVDPAALVKPIQDRAIASLQAISSRPFITLDSAYHSFYPSHDTEVMYHSFTVQNLSSKKIKVTAVIDRVTLSNADEYSISVFPDTFTISKHGTTTVTVALKCITVPPVCDASALFYFLVQPKETAAAVADISRYFVMCDIIPPVDNEQSSYAAKSNLADVLHKQYKAAKQSMEVLKTYIPHSVLRYFAKNPEPPFTEYCETFKASVIFLDVSGFTMLTAQMALLGDVGPEMISTHLNSYFGALICAAERFGGELVKSAGDAIMCVFREQPGEQLELRDLAIRAIQCGLEIQQSHSVYDSGQGFTLSLHVGIGVGNISLMFVGGVNNHWMHIVAGDPLSQLSTCVDVSNSGEVVVSPQCHQLVTDVVQSEPRNSDYLIFSFVEDFLPLEYPLVVPVVPLSAESALRCFIHHAILPSLENNEWQLDELRKLTSIFVKIGTDNFNTNNPDFYCSSLQEAFSCMQACIIQYEGLVCQFLQDDKGVIFFAAFGVPPYSHADDPLRAIRAAVDIYNGLTNIGVPCSIGVYTGFVFTGVVGSSTRHDYTVLGDAVNMAARLMGKAHQLHAGVLCGKTTYESCSLRVQFDILDPVKVKGKHDAIPIYRPHLSQQHKKLLDPTPGNIIGRTQEKILIAKYLIELTEHYLLGSSVFAQHKQEQLSRTIIFEGPPGIGKSFLAQFAIREAQLLSLNIAMGGSKAIHQMTPYYSWRGILESLYQIDITAPDFTAFRNEIEKAMDPRLFKYISVMQMVIPQLPCSQEEMNFGEKLRVGEHHHYINEIMKALIELRSCQSPLIIAFEDLQWMDASSLRLLNTISTTVHSILLIITTRDLTDSLRRSLSILSNERTDHIILTPLTDRDCSTILLKHLNRDHLPRELRPMITQVQGNPLYCEELAFGLLSRKILNGDNLLQTVNKLDIPDSVEGLISSRLDLQRTSAQTLLKVASVIGYEFDLAVLQGIYKGKIGSDIKLLQAQNFIIQNSPSSYIFRSEVVCKVAYSRLLVSKRKELHTKIALWYEKLQEQSDNPSQYIQLLAHHWFEAFNGQEDLDDESLNKVVSYMIRSADIATAILAIDEAAAILQRALQFVEQVTLPSKARHMKKLKLQLIGLPVRNLHGFSMRDNPSKCFKRISSQPTKVHDVIHSKKRSNTLAVQKVVDTSSAPRTPPQLQSKETNLQGVLKRKSDWTGRYKSVYCILEGGATFSLYSNTKRQKLKDSFDLKLASIRVLPSQHNEEKGFAFSISQLQGSVTFLASSEVERQHWVDALSVHSEVPFVTIDVNIYSSIALVKASAAGKIEAFNQTAQKLFRFSEREVLGHSITMLVNGHRQIQKYLKHQSRDVIGTPIRGACTVKDNNDFRAIICLAEYTDEKGVHILASFREEIELPDEIRYVVDQEFQNLVDETARRGMDNMEYSKGF